MNPRRQESVSPQPGVPPSPLNLTDITVEDKQVEGEGDWRFKSIADSALGPESGKLPVKRTDVSPPCPGIRHLAPQIVSD